LEEQGTTRGDECGVYVCMYICETLAAEKEREKEREREIEGPSKKKSPSCVENFERPYV